MSGNGNGGAAEYRAETAAHATGDVSRSCSVTVPFGPVKRGRAHAMGRGPRQQEAEGVGAGEHSFADLKRQRIPFEDLTVSVVTLQTLFEMKKDTVRPKDRIDAAWLRVRFDVERT